MFSNYLDFAVWFESMYVLYSDACTCSYNYLYMWRKKGGKAEGKEAWNEEEKKDGKEAVKEEGKEERKEEGLL